MCLEKLENIPLMVVSLMVIYYGIESLKNHLKQTPVFFGFLKTGQQQNYRKI